MTSDKKLILQLYRNVILVRKCEDAIRREYASDHLKTPVHLCNGSEAIAAGVLSALPSSVRVFGTYRNHGLYLVKTNDTDGFFGELYGKASGCAQGKAGSMHLTSPNNGFMLTSAVVGTTIPVAVGAAFSNLYLKNRNWVVVFFGDGALEEGVFWESMNFACLHQLPVVFVCEDNDLAIHSLGKDRRGFQSIIDIVKGFRCVASEGDGFDPIKVRELTNKSFKKAQNAKLPLFLRLKYFRQLEHVGINEDFKAGYRKKPDSASFKKVDPVFLARQAAIKKRISAAQLDQIDSEIDYQIEKSIQKAKKEPFPQKSVLFDHVLVSHE